MPKKGVLLVHGLTGSPHEFVPVAAALRDNGYSARLATLPGHGDEPDRPFHQTSALEVLDHVANEYRTLAAEVDEAYVVGHSLGGICTLLTAAVKPPKLQGIVVFSAPYEHAFMYNYWHGFARMPLHHLVKGIAYAPRYRFHFKRPVCHPWHVPKLLDESKVMFNLLKEHVHKIDVPVAIAHSIYDLTIPYQEMHKLARVLGNPDQVKTYTLRNSGHRIFPLSRDFDEALRIIFDFLGQDGPCMVDPLPRQSA